MPVFLFRAFWAAPKFLGPFLGSYPTLSVFVDNFWERFLRLMLLVMLEQFRFSEVSTGGDKRGRWRSQKSRNIQS
jgi:hypothetical protein